MATTEIKAPSAQTLIGRATKKKLGEMLLERNLITPQQLKDAFKIQQNDGGKLGEILIRQHLVREEDLTILLGIQLNVPFVDLTKYEVQPEAIRLVPEEIARKHIIIPLNLTADDALIVAMAFPDDVRTIRDIMTRTGKRLQVAIASVSSIKNTIDMHYRASSAIENSVKKFISSVEDKEKISSELIAQSPVAESLDLILNQAVRDRASDVHIEPQLDRLRIRYRIDGILHDTYILPLSAHGPLISRIKILAEMNIAEQRRPQDGQLSTKVGDREVDIRVATIATAYGERVTMRILDKSMTPLSLEEVGFLPEQLAKYRNVLKSSFGTVLVGGPTGSGKTTTLYASLKQFDWNSQNIMTVEDPIEYKFLDINQTQINAKADIIFSNGLRAILRHDPDIVLVGEIRDKETAQIATQAALTGRLVLASIHANDSVGILFRLIDLGVEPYLISPTLVVALAQRMVRRVCPYCKIPYKASPDEGVAYAKEMGEGPTILYQGSGCNMCANTGYRGRVALTELLVMTKNLRHMLLTGASAGEIKDAALKEDMLTMQRDGMLKAKMGITTISEVLRSTFSVY